MSGVYFWRVNFFSGVNCFCNLVTKLKTRADKRDIKVQMSPQNAVMSAAAANQDGFMSSFCMDKDAWAPMLDAPTTFEQVYICDFFVFFTCVLCVFMIYTTF